MQKMLKITCIHENNTQPHKQAEQSYMKKSALYFYRRARKNLLRIIKKTTPSTIASNKLTSNKNQLFVFLYNGTEKS